ncbi:MAG: protein-export chaperone SecB [Succinivibrio sp.]|nr:protein-export chaperone SecB [Succinivibrio sp.]
MSENTENQNPESANGEAQGPQFDVLRIYSKDCSLETPNVPEVFRLEWKPKLKVEFDSKPTALEDDLHEVDLRVTVTCTIDETVVYVCEVHQAGLFLIKNVPAEALEYLLAAQAPNILFPYAREHIASLINRSTFPPLNLRPINFEGLFRARKAQEAQEAKGQQEQSSAPADGAQS